jgi:hypothetical protein
MAPLHAREVSCRHCESAIRRPAPAASLVRSIECFGVVVALSGSLSGGSCLANTATTTPSPA